MVVHLYNAWCASVFNDMKEGNDIVKENHVLLLQSEIYFGKKM